MKSKRNPIFIYGLLGLILFGVTLWKRTWSYTEPTLWAEDGLFLHDAMTLGVKSIYSFYAGYLHLFAKTVSFLVSVLLPMQYWAIGVIATCFFAHWLMAIDIAKIEMKRGPLLSLLCGLSIIFLPTSGEIYLNLANLQWPMVIWCFYSLFLAGPENQTLPRQLLMIVAAFSSPFCALMVLIAFVVKAFGFRPYLWGFVGLSVYTQIVHAIVNPAANSQSSGFSLNDTLIVLMKCADGISGGRWTYVWLGSVGLFTLYTLIKGKGAFFASLIPAVYLAVVAKRIGAVISIVNAHGGGARYFFPLYGMLLILFFVKGNRPIRITSAILFWGLSLPLNLKSHQNFENITSWHDEINSASPDQCIYSILPPGWKVDLCSSKAQEKYSFQSSR